MPKMKETPSYIKSLGTPISKSPQARRVWSIDLETVWLPFFRATTTMGDTAFSIPLEALGAPIRLGYDKDGSVKFSNSGRPITKVAKPISDSVNLIRQNFVATLQDYAVNVPESKPEEYANTIKLSEKAGKPILAHDRAELNKAVQAQLAEAIAEAEALVCPQAQEEAQTVPDGELVAVS